MGGLKIFTRECYKYKQISRGHKCRGRITIYRFLWKTKQEMLTICTGVVEVSKMGSEQTDNAYWLLTVEGKEEE